MSERKGNLLKKKGMKKIKSKDAVGIYMLKCIECVSVVLRMISRGLEESSLVSLIFYGHLDMHVVRLRTGLERRTSLNTLKPSIAVVFFLCTQVMVLTHPRWRVNTSR